MIVRGIAGYALRKHSEVLSECVEGELTGSVRRMKKTYSNPINRNTGRPYDGDDSWCFPAGTIIKINKYVPCSDEHVSSLDYEILDTFE